MKKPIKNVKKKGVAAKPLSPFKPDVIKNKKPKAVDVSDFEQDGATEGQLQKITQQAAKAVGIDKQIADLEAAVATLKEERDTILNKTLPNMMDSAGMSHFDLTDGTEINIKEVVSGTLPNAEKKPEERKAALDWLMRNGGKGLIKTKFVSEFGVGQERMVKFFEQVIRKNNFAAKKDIGVHPQTLCAFVRELLEDGKQVPIQTLGIYVGRHAKITLSEKAAQKAESERIRPKGMKGHRQDGEGNY